MSAFEWFMAFCMLMAWFNDDNTWFWAFACLLGTSLLLGGA